jgi:uncharacterized protein YgfB (UPF0149 family)
VVARSKVNVTKFININSLPSFLQQSVEVRRPLCGDFIFREKKMSTNSRGVVSQFDFEELANQLLEQGLTASPADLHGCIAGLLAAGANPQAEAGLAALHQALDLDLYGELAEQVMALYVATGLALVDDDFDFHPLLLDDSADLVSRTEALAGWARSFLSGYAHASAAVDQQTSALPGDSSEVLRDLAAIAEADTDEIEEDEESERAYAELTEYIRFAALNAYADRVPGVAVESARDPQGPELH